MLGRRRRSGSRLPLLLWSRTDARRRVGALIGLALLIAIGGGSSLAAFAGARRSATALDRLRAQTYSVDAAAFGGPDQIRKVTSDSHVAVAAPFTIAAVTSVDDPDLFPFFVPGNDSLGRTIERPRILEGRRAHPERADEIVLPEATAHRLHKGVGDRIAFSSATPEATQAAESDQPETDGPKFTLRIVGISRSAAGLSVREQDIQLIYLTEGWRNRFAAKIGVLGGGVLVRLRHGFADFGAWSRAVNPNADPESRPTPLFSPAPVDDSVSVIVDGLRLFALVAAIVTLIALVQAIGRHAAGSRADLEVLRALGTSRGERAVGVTLAITPALVSGAIGAMLVAFAWSPLMPIGLARRAEPDRGFSFDGRILGGGTVLAGLAVIVIVALVAWRVAASGKTRPPRASGDRSRRRLGRLPPVVATGWHLATSRGRGRDVVPVRSAMSGVAVAVAGVVAVSMFASGLQRLINTSDRYGVPWDATAFHGNNDPPRTVELDQLEHIREVDAIAMASAQLDGLLNGQADGTGIALAPRRGRLTPVMRTGRAPTAGDEIALGLDTAHRLGVDLGDRILLTGSGGRRSMRVVGEALLPTVDDPATLASGFVVAPAAVTDLKLAQNDAFERLVVTFKPGVSRDDGVRALRAAGFEVSTPAPPPEVARLRDVQSLPPTLALLLALIGSVVVVLVLVVTVRFRRRDLALLRVFGFRRRQITSAVICEGCVFAAIGFAIGAPLGLVIGRFAWQHIAGALGVATDPAVPAGAIMLTALGVTVVAIAAALTPALRAARLRPAEILHQE